MLTPTEVGILIALLVLQAAGAAFLMHLFRRHFEFYKHSRIVDGVVSRIVEYRDADGWSYEYTYTYAVDGTTYQVKEESSRKWFRPRKGQPITIYHSPATPEEGRCAHPSHGFLFLGGALLCISVGFLIAVLLIKNI